MSLAQLASICNGRVYPPKYADTRFSGVAIDSRKVSPEQLFVAIRGEINDGHDFIGDALKAGATGCLVNADWATSSLAEFDSAVVVVESTNEAILRLAKDYRRTVNPSIGAITGSNGKTTTKEYASTLLRAVEPNSYSTPGNLNNLFGLPLSIFSMPQATRSALFEIGISTKDEMPILADVASADVVCITNVGPSHLHKLNNVEEVARTKLQLASLSGRDTVLVVNADDPILMQEASKLGLKRMTFALTQPADFLVESILEQSSGQTIVIDGHEFHLAIPGRHQAANLLAAYALIRLLGYSFDRIDTETLEFTTAPMRGQLERIGEHLVMADCYNANPASMRASLGTFSRIQVPGRRIAVLGDMLELGAESEKYHAELGRLTVESDIDLVVFVGELTRNSAAEAKRGGKTSREVLQFPDSSEASRYVSRLNSNDAILIKGSRGVRLELVLEALRKLAGQEEKT